MGWGDALQSLHSTGLFYPRAMPTIDSRKRDLLATMGVEVWELRAGDGESVTVDAAAEVADQPATVTPAVEPASVATPSTVESSTVKSTVESTVGSSTVAAESTVANTVESTVESSTVTDDDSVAESTDTVTTVGGDESLVRIAGEVAACRKCALHQTRTNTVPGAGHARADWFFIGEAPGRDEDAQGEPFVGRAGRLLDAMIAALGLRREEVFIANVLKCRPPDNRDPTAEEVELCEAYLHRQLALIQPKVIVALGRISAQALLKTDTAIGKLRGATHNYVAANIPLVVTYHPAYLLRSPEQKAKAWDDLWLAKTIVAGGDSPAS